MKCKKCGNEIGENELFCSKCGKKVKKEGKAADNKLVLGIVIAGVIIAYAIIIGIIVGIKQKGNNIGGKIEQIGSNGQVISKTSQLSFSNMKTGDKDLKLNDDQYEVLKYFDDNYFYVYNSEDLQRYPKVYNGAQIRIDCWIKKILKSTDDEFVCLGVIGAGGEGENYGEMSDFEEKDFFAVKGKQLDERLIVNDEIVVYGTYTGVETFEVDGKSYTVPVIDSIYNYNVYDTRFDLTTITKVAKYIFGNDIKITVPEDTQAYGYDASSPMYLISLDNQSNANFKQFCAMREIGYIGYTSGYGEEINKRLQISADFQHYIVQTLEPSINRLYIDYYDKDFNKIWGREFDYKTEEGFSGISSDYTANQLAMVLDGDLYLLDLATGNDEFEPVLVGEKVGLTMLSDRMLLLGNSKKDTIMYVDYSGNIMGKINIDTDMEKINAVDTQIVNNKMVVRLYGYLETQSPYYPYWEYKYLNKYVVLNDKGEVEMSTKDTDSF